MLICTQFSCKCHLMMRQDCPFSLLPFDYPATQFSSLVSEMRRYWEKCAFRVIMVEEFETGVTGGGGAGIWKPRLYSSECTVYTRLIYKTGIWTASQWTIHKTTHLLLISGSRVWTPSQLPFLSNDHLNPFSHIFRSSLSILWGFPRIRIIVPSKTELQFHK